MNKRTNKSVWGLRATNLTEFWEHGQAVEAELGRRKLGYGDSPMDLLASEAFRGVTSAGVHLRSLRFFRRFGRAEVLRMHKLQVPVRALESVMPFFPSGSEARRSQDDVAFAAQIAQRKRKAREFLNRLGRGELKVADFRKEVISWHKNHMHLFSPGKTNKLAIESVGRLRQHAVELMGEAAECDAILAANGRAGSAPARKRLRQLIKALKKTSSIAC